MSDDHHKFSIGTGVLQWGRAERIGDRYGAVCLHKDMSSGEPDNVVDLDNKEIDGALGTLIAVILETRESGHIGDLFRGFQPGGAEVGDTIVLGRGNVFFTDSPHNEGYDYEWDVVGVKPADSSVNRDRETDWLDAGHLYQCHEQTVELFFVVHKDDIDEMCTCGHLRVEHTDTVEKGHGRCTHECDCQKFTWTRFLAAVK